VSYSFHELQYLMKSLQSEGSSTEIAFGYFSKSENAIYFSGKHGEWPPIVNLLQGVGGNKFTKENIFVICCPQEKVMVGDMTKGMLDFFTDLPNTQKSN
jgi:hypothetical protein